MKTIRSFVLWWLAASILLVSAVRAQGSAPPAGDAAAPPPFTAQELDALLAPIALYPDALLSQILMAATYPLEVVQAARWSKANPGSAATRQSRRPARKAGTSASCPWSPFPMSWR